ncbi:MAG: EamA family transporter [Anaerolineae bacterium]
MSEREKLRGTGLSLVVLATACWSTSGLFISLVVRDSGISPWGLAFWRDLGTFACLLLGITVFGSRSQLKVNRRDLLWLAAMGGISIGLFHVMWNMAVLINGVSVATVIQANAPIFVTLMAWLLWREPMTRRKAGAVLLAFVGTLLIARLDSLGAAQITVFGLLVALAAALAYGGFSLFGKKLVGAYSPWTVLLYAFGFGALTLLPFQMWVVVPWPLPPRVLLWYAALILLSTIAGFVLYTTGLRRLQASVAAIVATTEVPFAAGVSYVVLGERLDGWQALGAVLVIGGVVLLSWPREGFRSIVADRRRVRDACGIKREA